MSDDTETETPNAASLALSKARSALRRAIDETDDARARSAAVDRQMTTRRECMEAAEQAEAEAFDDLVKAIAAKRLGAQP